MNHIVYLDAKSREMQALLDSKKSMIIRGAAGRKLPYGRVFKGDSLYFINNNAEGIVKAKGMVISVYNSTRLNETESTELIKNNQDKLQLDDKQMKRWCGRRYIVLVEVGSITSIEPFTFDKSNYGNMDDWLIVEETSLLLPQGTLFRRK